MENGSKTFSFPKEKMHDYMEERQAIANPFTHKFYASRPNPSPFVKQPKANPVKKRTVIAKHNIDKLSQPKKWM